MTMPTQAAPLAMQLMCASEARASAKLDCRAPSMADTFQDMLVVLYVRTVKGKPSVVAAPRGQSTKTLTSGSSSVGGCVQMQDRLRFWPSAFIGDALQMQTPC